MCVFALMVGREEGWGGRREDAEVLLRNRWRGQRVIVTPSYKGGREVQNIAKNSVT